MIHDEELAFMRALTKETGLDSDTARSAEFIENAQRAIGRLLDERKLLVAVALDPDDRVAVAAIEKLAAFV